MHPVTSIIAVVGSATLLVACTEQGADTRPETLPATSATPGELTLQVRSANGISAQRLIAGEQAGSLVISSEGIQLLDSDDKPAATALPGYYDALAVHQDAAGLIAASHDLQRDQPVVLRWNAAGVAAAPEYLPSTGYPLEDLCFYQDQSNHDYLFLIGEEGLGQQWLIGEQGATSRLVRNLHLPVGAKGCAVNTALGALFISEEGIGIWQYAAHPETDSTRSIVDLVQPWGTLPEGPEGLAATDDGLLALDTGSNSLHRYRWQNQQWQHDSWQLTEGSKPEQLSARAVDDTLQVLITDDNGVQLLTELTGVTRPANTDSLPEVLALSQTQPVPHGGDAADDPAIWPHPSIPELARVLGTDKRGGLGVYDLQGHELQYLPVGRINNVDLRKGFTLGDQTIDLAVASNRDRNSLELFAIDPASGRVTGLGDLPTELTDIYGLCMAQSPQGVVYAIPNDKDGRFIQYRLDGSSGQITAKAVRQFKTDTQPEGCVADDARQTLFIGEEGVGIWTLSSAEDQPTELAEVARVSELLHDDVEGMAVYQHQERPYLIVSSQGNDSYVVFDALPPYAAHGAFRIGLNAGQGIDGVSETDGLEVSSADFGAAWPGGLLVVQDGRKRLPEGNQNFKLVPWQPIAELLQLP
ncbi:phytase [Halopseudomonas maritima]|uniref:phytase n=1 Tax=Halopseudomonas maritima TaxID=2918528 RepID=UPI001EECD1DE|nr:phytase [Halopseudomonas maritima]UJJ31461.1 phytase [Halopseudomonas maritima]